MRGYVHIPASVNCKVCRYCGSSPVIALAEKDGYVVKCPNDESHYQTKAGLIDIEDWNFHNTLHIENIPDIQRPSEEQF